MVKASEDCESARPRERTNKGLKGEKRAEVVTGGGQNFEKVCVHCEGLSVMGGGKRRRFRKENPIAGNSNPRDHPQEEDKKPVLLGVGGGGKHEYSNYWEGGQEEGKVSKSKEKGVEKKKKVRP